MVMGGETRGAPYGMALTLKDMTGGGSYTTDVARRSVPRQGQE